MSQMGFNYNYSLVQKISNIQSGVLFVTKITNFLTIEDKKNYESLLLGLEKKLLEAFGLEVFRHDHDTLFLLSANRTLKDEIHIKITEIGSEIFSEYLMISIGYTEFANEQPNDVIYRALCSSSIACRTGRALVSYSECTSEISDLDKTLEKATIFHNAIKKNELNLVFQAVVDVEKSEFLFHEVLLRIGKEQTIYDFILAAESTGLIYVIDEFVAKQSTQLMQENQDLKLSINVSLVNINNPIWVEKMFSLFKSIPLIARKTILEITENYIFNDYKRVFDFIFKFKSIGCQIAIDDFGESFYLPFLKLEKLPVDFIKLDGGFAKSVLYNENIKIFIDAIIKIAENSGIKIIAEFIENKETFTLFRSMGIRYMQGNYFYKASKQIHTVANI